MLSAIVRNTARHTVRTSLRRGPRRRLPKRVHVCARGLSSVYSVISGQRWCLERVRVGKGFGSGLVWPMSLCVSNLPHVARFPLSFVLCSLLSAIVLVVLPNATVFTLGLRIVLGCTVNDIVDMSQISDSNISHDQVQNPLSSSTIGLEPLDLSIPLHWSRV